MSRCEPAQTRKCRVGKLALAYSANKNFLVARLWCRIAFASVAVSRVHLGERQFPSRLNASFVLAPPPPPPTPNPYGMNEYTSELIISPKATMAFHGDIKRATNSPRSIGAAVGLVSTGALTLKACMCFLPSHTCNQVSHACLCTHTFRLSKVR